MRRSRLRKHDITEESGEKNRELGRRHGRARRVRRRRHNFNEALDSGRASETMAKSVADSLGAPVSLSKTHEYAGSKATEADRTKGIRRFFNLRDGRASYFTIRKRIVDGARINGIHVCILIVAMLIASIGLNVDSTEAIVGAMLICPLMGSVLAIAYSIASADSRFLKESIQGLILQIVICLATSTLYFVLSPLSNETSELLTNSSPTIWDVLIALAGGFAGGIGNSRKEEPSTLIAGVAVATALMPPLCASGYGIAMRNPHLFLSAFYEFMLNVVFIALSAEVVFMLLRVPLHFEHTARQNSETSQAAATSRHTEAAKPNNASKHAVAAQQHDKHVPAAQLREEPSSEEIRQLEQHAHAVRRRLMIGTLVFLIPCALTTAQVVSQTMAQNSGEVFDEKDQYDTQLTTKELQAICPQLQSYSIGDQQSYDEQSNSLKTRVTAQVTTTMQLDDTKRAEVESLIRVHVPQVDSVEFDTPSAGAN